VRGQVLLASRKEMLDRRRAGPYRGTVSGDLENRVSLVTSLPRSPLQMGRHPTVRRSRGSPNSDTGGEFLSRVAGPESGDDGASRQGATRLPDASAEFATSVNSRVTRGHLGQVAVQVLYP
jgi:hypothetical protein